MAPISTAQI
uniref:Uncharacterized protein n=1 Tax=Arundo donax TaxID=35708 RepID=A0A0A9H7T9_ARUDO